MAPLSISDIIQKHPIGRGLDAFRDSFSSACAELGCRDSSDAVRQFSHEGKMLQPAFLEECYLLWYQSALFLLLFLLLFLFISPEELFIFLLAFLCCQKILVFRLQDYEDFLFVVSSYISVSSISEILSSFFDFHFIQLYWIFLLFPESEFVDNIVYWVIFFYFLSSNFFPFQ